MAFFSVSGLIAMDESEEVTGGTSLSGIQPLQEQKAYISQKIIKKSNEKNFLEEAIDDANEQVKQVEKKENRDLYYQQNIDPKTNQLNQINEAIASNEKRKKMIEEQIKKLKFESGLG